MAKELKRRGFVFVGPTTAYALMQATGMVDDHVADCFRARGPVPTRGGLMLDGAAHTGSLAPERTASTDAASPFCPGRSGAAGEGGTHGGHEAAHG